ncbi:hypothetical protein H0H92_014267 [Tricholoma furcatifolium]|nr:hypothetical protein H0H92_014267 [Tricholoma furcatifolium]
MALSVSGFPEPLRQLDTDEGALNPLQRGLGLFTKKRQNTDDSIQDLVAETSPVSISTTDELAQMTILQPPPITTSSFQRPRQVSLTRRTPPPPQRKLSLGRLEIGSVPNRPSLPKPPQEPQLPVMAHPRPLPAVPMVSQGPIVESSKSAAMRAASSSPTIQSQPRLPPSRVILAAPSRPRAHTTVPQAVDVRYQSMAVDPTDTPGASLSSSISVAPPTLPLPSVTQPMSSNTPPSGPRPLPRIPPVTVTVSTPTSSNSPAPIPTGPLSATATTSSSNLQPPRQPRAKRPKTSPSAPAGFVAATRGPLDGVPSSWVSRPVDLNPSAPSASGSSSGALAFASGSSTHSGLNAQESGSGSIHASESGSNAHASSSGSASSASIPGSAPGSAPRALPRPRSNSRTREHSVEAFRSRSRGAASPILRSSLASGSTTAPLPSSSGSGTTTPPGSRRASNNSNPSTPRSSVSASNRSPTVSPRVPSLPPPRLARALPSTSKIPEEGSSISRASTSTISTSTHAPTPARSKSVGPTSILKNSKNRTSAKQQSLQVRNASPVRSSTPQKPAVDSNTDVEINATSDAEITTTTRNGSSHISRSPSPMRYARPASRQSLSSDDDSRSRSRSRSQLRYMHSYRPKQVERSPSPIAYAKRSSADMDILEPELLLDDGDAEDELNLGLSPKQRRHTQPRSYQFEYRGPAPEDVDREWGEMGRKDSKDNKDNKEEKENKEVGGTWDTVLNYAGSRRVRKRSKSKASTGARDSRPGTTTHTPTDSVIDITSPMPSSESNNRPFTPSQLNARDSLERAPADVRSESPQRTGRKKPSTHIRRPSAQAPVTPPPHSPPSSVRTRTSSDVSQHRPHGHARVKSEGSGHRARLSGVLPGVAWGADVNTEQFSPDAKLVPLRRGMYSGFESEDEDEEPKPSRQVLDIDMVRAIPMLRRLRAR